MPENKKRLSEMTVRSAKKRLKARRANEAAKQGNGLSKPHSMEAQSSENAPTAEQVAYIYGRFEGFIEAFARSSQVSKHALAKEVGNMLRK
jgi:hypothetical protein